jgi:hypothetical protein
MAGHPPERRPPARRLQLRRRFSNRDRLRGLLHVRFSRTPGQAAQRRWATADGRHRQGTGRHFLGLRRRRRGPGRRVPPCLVPAVAAAPAEGGPAERSAAPGRAAGCPGGFPFPRPSAFPPPSLSGRGALGPRPGFLPPGSGRPDLQTWLASAGRRARSVSPRPSRPKRLLLKRGPRRTRARGRIAAVGSALDAFLPQGAAKGRRCLPSAGVNEFWLFRIDSSAALSGRVSANASVRPGPGQERISPCDARG